MDPDLSVEILRDYGKAMKHDFSAEVPEMNQHAFLEEHPDDYIVPTDLEQAIKQADRWKAKYYLLLEKYNQLLEEKLKKWIINFLH